jgi:CDP-paratose 2-epimerase
MIYCISGGCGFLGSNLAGEVMRRGEKLVVIDNLYRFGAEKNLEWLRERGAFEFIYCDVRNREDVERAIKKTRPDVIFHLAGQVAMTTSIDNPRIDFETNALGTLNILESVRLYSPESIIIYSSTNKVYGDLEWVEYRETDTRYETPRYPRGFPESIPLDFHSPYGCSKGAADQYMLDYHRIFGLRTVVYRHSSMFGTRQFSTFDQGWIGWFCEQAIKSKAGKLENPFTISGNGKQVRDVLFADDMIALYMQTVERIKTAGGQAFNIGGGMKNSLSLLELFALLEKELSIKLNYTVLPPRESDQKVFVADTAKAEQLIGWSPKVDSVTGVKKMLEWVAANEK